MKKQLIWITAGLLLITLLLTALWIYTDRNLYELELQGQETVRYDRHYAFISADTSSLWQDIFDNAGEIGAEKQDFVEWIGKDAPVEYSPEDCIRIASASGVDGIILYKNASMDMTSLIDEAAREGIPTVTLFNDESGSGRISFVGANSYQMGEIYAGEVLKALHEGENHILVLTADNVEEGGFSLLYSQMLQVLDAGKQPDREAILTAHMINTQTSFDAEEDIRDIFLHSEQLPDIMVCLDPISTECAAQALIDYNEVGNISVIGYYASEAVADAVSKGIVQAALQVDAREIAQLCLEALDEYWTLGRVSNYFNISLSMVTQEADSHEQ